MVIKIYPVYLLLFLLLVGCSGYEKLLKSSDFELKYTKAFEYYAKGDYTKAMTLFDQIAPYFRGSSQGDSVYFYQAMVNFKLNDFIMAGHYFKTFTTVYGNSPFVEDASFYVGYCFYLSSPRPVLDQTDTHQAIQAFRLFLIKYPQSSRRPEVERMIQEMREKLVEKSFISARLYFDLQDYKAAIVALGNSLNDFPESKYREEILFMVLKSSYQYASNSIYARQKERYQAAVDEYYSFVSEYPASRFKKDADRMFASAARFLRIDIDEARNESNIK